MELANGKRPRGRPKGSGKDDRPTLEKVADMLVESSDLTPSAAMRRCGATDPSHLRRLQVKWKASGASYLEAAQTRQAGRRRPAGGGGYGTGGGGFAALDRLIAGIVPSQLADVERQVALVTQFDSVVARAESVQAALDMRYRAAESIESAASVAAQAARALAGPHAEWDLYCRASGQAERDAIRRATGEAELDAIRQANAALDPFGRLRW